MNSKISNFLENEKTNIMCFSKYFLFESRIIIICIYKNKKEIRHKIPHKINVKYEKN